MPRRNLLRERLADPKPLIGAYLSLPSPELVELLGHAGFDWVFFDAEHGGIGLETCYSLVRAADAVGLPTMVRVPVNDPTQVLIYAETGANAVMVPHVQRPEDAQQLVQSLRYWPRGNRGAMAGSRAANYGLTQPAGEYFAADDLGPLAVALLEDKVGCEGVGEIAQVPGLDVFFLGPSDLAMSVGLPAQTDHPTVRALLDGATEQLVAGGRTVGTIVPTPEAAQRAFAMGMRMVLVSVGLLLATQIRRFLDEARA